MIKLVDIIEECNNDNIKEILEEVQEQRQEKELERFILETFKGASINNIVSFIENEIEYILEEIVELEEVATC